MQTITTNTEARVYMMGFLVNHGTGLPDSLVAAVQLLMAAASPVDQMVKVAELLYASKDVLNNEARSLAGSLAAFCAENYWHGLDVDDRGHKIKKAMMRDMGEPAPTGGWPAPADDPEPSPQFAHSTAQEITPVDVAPLQAVVEPS